MKLKLFIGQRVVYKHHWFFHGLGTEQNCGISQLCRVCTCLHNGSFVMSRGLQEFANCNWTKKEKVQLAPNIVAFTRKFNHVSVQLQYSIVYSVLQRIQLPLHECYSIYTWYS